MDRNDKKLFFETIGKEISKKIAEKFTNLDKYTTYFAAIRTKPFILLAGISGTGKSRLVRELAYMSCPKLGKLQEDPTTPGNFCMIEVKPNWHDSSELLGYTSGIKNKYVITPFVKFLVKAMRYPEVPFFVCLDEMNLAPVEQYFAEYLSVLETRKMEDDSIISGSLINNDVFKSHDSFDDNGKRTNSNIFMGLNLYSAEREDVDETVKRIEIETELKEFGLRLPQNIIVVGTVNMDDTTHQFSRKVVDRAMTIEMNELNFDNMFTKDENLNYCADTLDAALFISDCVSANQALELIDFEKAERLKAESIAIMNSLDVILKDTPFRVAYRVQNELVLYFRNLYFANPEKEFEELFSLAVDAILKMKILPRIEGDEDLVEKPLKDLDSWSKESYTNSNTKIKEMLVRLERSHYTSYWP
jgi:energy-coupling factor transporter ATP-binding protein EcfA2